MVTVVDPEEQTHEESKSGHHNSELEIDNITNCLESNCKLDRGDCTYPVEGVHIVAAHTAGDGSEALGIPKTVTQAMACEDSEF